MSQLQILQDLYNSEINAAIWWNWDGGVEVRMGNGIYGDDKNWEQSGNVKDMDDATQWLVQTARLIYPNSKFVKEL